MSNKKHFLNFKKIFNIFFIIGLLMLFVINNTIINSTNQTYGDVNKQTSSEKLSSVLTTKELGQVDARETDKVKSAIITKNDSLKDKDLQVTLVEKENKAKVTSNDYNGEVEVRFTVKKDLSEVLKSKTDKIQLSDEEAKENTLKDQSFLTSILNKVKKDANSDVSLEDVTITTDGQKLKVVAKTNSTKFKGTVEFNFTTPKDLSSVLTTKELGQVDARETDKVKSAIITKNDSLKDEDLQVTLVEKENKAKVTSNDYNGEVEVRFTVKKDLSEVLKSKTDKIQLSDEEAKENTLKDQSVLTSILNKVKKDANSDVSLEDVTITTDGQKLKVVAKTNSTKFKGTVEFNFTTPKDLSSVLTTKELGQVDARETDKVKSAIITKNDSLKDEDLQVTLVEKENKAKVTSNDYNGEVEVTFTVKKDLSEVLKSKTDKIQLSDEEAKENTLKDQSVLTSILNKVKKDANSDVSLEDVTITTDGQKLKVVAKTNSTKFKGTVEFNFTTPKDLSSVLTTKELGQVDARETDKVKSAIITKNDSLKDEDLQVTLVEKENKAKVTSNDYNGEVEVTFTVKKDLSEVLKSKTDKIQLSDEEAKENTLKDQSVLTSILNKVKKDANSDVSLEDVTITTDGQKLKVVAKTNSTKFKGTVEFNFTTPKDLSSVLTTKELGQVDARETDKVKSAIITKNDSLKDEDLQVTLVEKENKAKVTSNDYNGEVEVTFTVKKDLSEVLKSKTDKIQLSDEEAKENTLKDQSFLTSILNKVKKDANSDVNLEDVTITTDGQKLKVVAKTNSTKFKGTVEFNFTTPKDLSSVLTTKELGQVDARETDKVKSAIITKNDSLKDEDLQVTLVEKENKAKVTYNDYNGEVEVTFTVKKDLSSVLTTKELGQVDARETDKVKSAIITKNDSLKDEDLQVTLVEKENKAKVTYNDYNGEVEVTFTVKKDLSSVLTTKELGQVDARETDKVKSAIITKNDSLKDKDLQVTLVEKENKAKVTSNDYNGEVEVTFTVKKDLSSVLTTKELGQVDARETDKVKSAIITKNDSLKDKDLQVTLVEKENKAKVTSKDYDGEVEVTFTVKKSIIGWIILVILFVLALCGIIGIIIYKNKQNKNSNSIKFRRT
ncbi:variable membrane protein A [Candidatus Phytoplasma solani]|uniref:hypothetical protein n=1 Tax=Candidatus Phytoplasma solani TaxID=69896 RepID=UPI0032DB117B